MADVILRGMIFTVPFISWHHGVVMIISHTLIKFFFLRQEVYDSVGFPLLQHINSLSTRNYLPLRYYVICYRLARTGARAQTGASRGVPPPPLGTKRPPVPGPKRRRLVRRPRKARGVPMHRCRPGMGGCCRTRSCRTTLTTENCG